MRMLILVLVSASVGSILTAVVLQPRAAAVGGQGGGVVKCSTQNGDVNADGKIDLADPVTILGHLFLGSPTVLEQLCAPPAAPCGLPDTGQTKCYDASGVEIPCDSASCPGQDGSYASGCPSEGRFTDNGDGTVTDHCTGLMWQQDTADRNGDGQITVEDRIRWCDALAFCENLSFARHDDWRLPNLRELQSIVDYGHTSLAIDPVFGALPAYYWSSTTNASLPLNAWQFFFGGSDFSQFDGKDGRHHFRAVRNAP
jgi:hypothetical protein